MSEADTPNHLHLPEPEELNIADEHSTDLGQVEPTEWIALTKKLRQRNRQLLKQVASLEQSLVDCKQTLQMQQARSHGQETLLSQQTEELNTAREQVARLFRELESSHQVAQRQQILIETLSQQLETSQERVAKMERECALTQQRYQEQSHKLSQAENTAEELQTRLQRQQRQTLQFKAALEKCLEVPAPNYDAQAQHSTAAVSGQHLKSVIAAQTLLHKTQPIQPWSVQSDLLSDTVDEQSNNNNTPTQEFQSPDIEPKSLEQIPVAEKENIELAEEIITELSVTDEELEAQVLAEQPELARMYQLLNQPNADLSPNPNNVEVDDNASKQDLSWVEEIIGAGSTDEIHTEEEKGSTDTILAFATPSGPQSNEPLLPQPNWPSPVLYPLRTPKKRKSLASIDLPNFPRYRPSEV